MAGVVAVANEQVAITTVLAMVGVEVGHEVGSGRSRKLHCPFGAVYHSDGGVDPAMRVYPDSNSAYCFSCAAYYSPVSLAVKALDLDPVTAATRLLERAGIKPLDLAAAWAKAQHYEPPMDMALLADALKTYCRRITPDWGSRQFDAPVAATLTRCLGLLELVHSPQDAALWLHGCKAAMRHTLETGASEMDRLS
jgi:hypothetical protein